MAGFEVRFTAAARADLQRLYAIWLDRAQALEDLDAAQRVIDAIAAAAQAQLGRAPFIYRKADQSPFLRELIVPLHSAGYVLLYEIDAQSRVNILAVRHQREDDYY
ncbi:type II toxin-antitoxin system RelE/ParE family toxin [Paucibacter sp. PLA-PC-4]|uniref:type II toxin-antitoxin system RelE/ParE family toxin n=1 Tax=Paucibacter sp. PLA-PC-4 TaxID=2993655 RepID=UPI002248D65E|nr:type II toxin-antitoxin system RelE/ParE family toxin [Paucibacter sp. PLA-PC-4]MCX2860968.1 type II toxin-antitoxin system RelE/ParE family toxin [Paucibacter sp. PLA-PC-4]